MTETQKAAEFAKANTGSDEYWDGLTRTGYGRTPYTYQGDKCVAGCKRFSNYETKHHPDCPFYPNSLSKSFDDAIAGRSKSLEEKEKRVRELEEALRRARNDIIRLTDSDQPANKIHYPKYIDKVLNKKS